MGGGDTTTSTQTSGSSNPAVTNTLNSLLGTNGGIQGVLAGGPHVFDQSLYAGTGPTTQNAWQSSLAAASNPGYGAGVNTALDNTNGLLGSGGLTSGMSGNIGTSNSVGNTFGNLASGATDPSLTEQTLLGVAQGNALGQNDPGYAALRSKLSSDVMGQVGSGFTNSGRYGGGSYVNAATNDLTGALAPLDYQQYQDSLTRQNNALSAIEGQRQQGVVNQSNDLAGQLGASGQAFSQGQQGISNQSALASQLPGLFSALQAPSATAGAVGAAQDADTQGALSGNADLYSRQNNAQLGLLQQLIPLLTGGASAGGQTTTNTQPSTPWWQSALSIGSALL